MANAALPGMAFTFILLITGEHVPAIVMVSWFLFRVLMTLVGRLLGTFCERLPSFRVYLLAMHLASIALRVHVGHAFSVELQVACQGRLVSVFGPRLSVWFWPCLRKGEGEGSRAGTKLIRLYWCCCVRQCIPACVVLRGRVRPLSGQWAWPQRPPYDAALIPRYMYNTCKWPNTFKRNNKVWGLAEGRSMSPFHLNPCALHLCRPCRFPPFYFNMMTPLLSAAPASPQRTEVLKYGLVAFVATALVVLIVCPSTTVGSPATPFLVSVSAVHHSTAVQPVVAPARIPTPTHMRTAFSPNAPSVAATTSVRPTSHTIGSSPVLAAASTLLMFTTAAAVALWVAGRARWGHQSLTPLDLSPNAMAMAAMATAAKDVAAASHEVCFVDDPLPL